MNRNSGWVVAAILAALLGAGEASAVDIEGRWGISAALFDSRGDMSLIRGHSQRTAWIIDLQVRQDGFETEGETAPPGVSLPPDEERSDLSVAAGPGLRRYLRPGSELSPYWDAVVDGTYRRFRNGRGTVYTTEWLGAAARFDFGVEYFTRWHFSVAAHSGLASVAWRRVKQRVRDSVGTTGSSGHDQNLLLGLSPVLVARVYF